MTFSFSGMQESFWHIASFNTTEQDEFTKSMSFEDELGRAVTQFPDGLDKCYFYKHSDTQSVFYIPPELIGVVPLLGKYSRHIALLVNEPDLHDCVQLVL